MRKLFVLAFGLCFVGALLVPAAYLMLARDLPPLVTRDEVIHSLKVTIEGQRQKAYAGVDPRLVEPFALLGPQDISPALKATVLAEEGCPDYLSFPKEQNPAWLLRVVGYGAGLGLGDAGPGKCELAWADRVVSALGLPGQGHKAVAAWQVHQALEKQELLDLELSIRWFSEGVFGVRAASRRLMKKEPRALDLAESAELVLAELDWQGVLDCKNPTLLKIQRNNLIERIAALNLVKRAEAERAKGERLRCLERS